MTTNNYEVIHEPGQHPIKMWVKGVPVEESAKKQLKNLASLPFIHKWVAAMPDVHWGMGATVGSVIATHGAIIPAAVGVDIGCGMIAAKLPITASQLPENLSEVRTGIERVVPHGRTNSGGLGDRGAWSNPPPEVADIWKDIFAEPYQKIVDKHPKIRASNTLNHLGTLGGGNHFIELCIDESQNVWLMLHSGSRGVGNRIGSYFIEKAKEDMRRYFINLPDADLSYLSEGSQHFDDYMEALFWAQTFASINRNIMLTYARKVVFDTLKLQDHRYEGEVVVSCHHNYVQRERHFGKDVLLTRKGAVAARAGMLGIIPGSMGARSYIVRGKGNPESFNSCSHGAGRKMSRAEAKRTFTLEDHAKATAGVECRKDEEVIDETPGAYKDIDAVMAAQSDLVEVVHTLKQVLCVKG